MKNKLTVVNSDAKQAPIKKQNILIDYSNQENVWDDEGALYAPRPNIEFKDIKGYSLNGPYLIVQLHDDTQYVYPMSGITSLKLTVDTVQE